MDVVELFEQVAHGLAVERRGVAQRNMHAEDDELLLRDEAQILPQPLDLRIGEAPFVVRGVVFLVRQQNVVHGDDVGVAPVERVIARAELVFEVAASGQIEVAALVGDGGRHAVVVVAHHLKEFQSDLAFAHGQRDGRHHLVGDVFTPLVEDDIAQRNAVDGTFERRDMRADIGHGLLLETGQIRVFLYLRIGDADQFEVGFDRLLRHQNEVVAFLRLRKTLPEAGTALRHRDFTVGGDAVEDMEGVGMARHLVDAVGIGRHAREAVAHDDSSDRSAVGVRHYAVEIVPLLDRGVQRGLRIVVGAAREERTGGK